MKRNEIIQMWCKCFPDVSEAWISRLLSSPTVADDDILTMSDADGHPVSSLLLQRRELTFSGEIIPAAYLSFACTLPRYRGFGSMTSLLAEALYTARQRGAAVVALQPAADWLRYFYEKAGGWATTVYTTEDNYTGDHIFEHSGYHADVIASECEDRFIRAYMRFERDMNRSVLLHSYDDMRLVIADCREEGGAPVASTADDDKEFAAVAMAYPDRWAQCVNVKSLMGHSREARRAVLDTIQERYPGYRVAVHRPAPDNVPGNTRVRSLHPGAMMRVVNADMLLKVIERNNPDWRAIIKLSDNILYDNSGSYIIGKKAREGDEHTAVFEVNPAILARMIFGSKVIGKIINFPSTRAAASLLLE